MADLHYNAFISYRHNERDSRIAGNIQRELERFHIPAAIQKSSGIRRFERIFRDKEELPITIDLGDNIDQALTNSDFLIVICSPELLESRWCMREIELFLSKHPRSHVLTVLTKGEPDEVIPEALLSGHRVLVFSQFTRMLRILEQRLYASGVECFYLDGETPARERVEMTQRFNRGEGNVFLISLKAGGAGLNLTGADFVIHYDPWWNPAAEDQATDRAHRSGQGRPVTVARLITRGTVEERVLALSNRKRDLFERMIEAGETFPTSLTEEEIRGLFAE